MRTIVKEFIDGDSVKRLAIFSDIATITSVILASLLIPAFSLASTGLSFSSIASISVTVLIVVAISSILLAAFLSVDSWLAGRRRYAPLFRITLWCIATAVAILITAFIHDIMTNTYWT
ncbi:hypothetical protein Q3O60_16975 [Alkalimonas collagenimarina]|uniref:Uncharacterized protein n=1 Tax=Alkalimonas collagenimarina TaxID=400390 RepID=A0ABT9H3T2_9GAMM|nr:hypothetical protein [Alkalimonas collagenimarina]MDP4537878.1 hypothetical protein [Alkalimonas collagenimarina]